MTRKILITGGSSGIGLATARAFVQNGDTVHIASRSLEKLAAAKTDLGAVTTHQLDVTDQGGVDRLFDAIGPLDVLVANAGVCLQARLDDDDTDEVWRTTMDVNLNGVYYCLKAGARTLRDDASIVTVSSGLGKNARVGYEAYTASKHAVLGLTKCVALELAPRGVRVNAVCPGWVDTPMSRTDAREGARRAGKQEEAFRQEAIAGIPLGRMVEAGDVAELISFLCSGAASAITGQSYNVGCGEFFN
jgi:NAD(P)-dependent dehydrogenase (short-subunit alcohol dehydrogenase family)